MPSVVPTFVFLYTPQEGKNGGIWINKCETYITEKLTACASRKGCFHASYKKCQTEICFEHIVENEPLSFRGESLDGIRIQLGNTTGQTVNVEFVCCRKMGFQGVTLSRFSGDKLIERLRRVPENFLQQWYTYVHMELGGCCMAGTELDDPDTTRIDKLEAHYDALENREFDLNDNREQNYQALAADVKELKTQVKHLTDTLSSKASHPPPSNNESASKRQKSMNPADVAQKKLRKRIKFAIRSNDTGNGVHKAQIAEYLPPFGGSILYTMEEIETSLEYLCIRGHIYTTVNNDTYAMAK